MKHFVIIFKIELYTMSLIDQILTDLQQLSNEAKKNVQLKQVKLILISDCHTSNRVGEAV